MTDKKRLLSFLQETGFLYLCPSKHSSDDIMAGIYLHIPFCKRRCIYCDFYSTTMDGRKDEYISALCHELSMRQHYLEDERIKTIYWGGGTPSQLEERHFRTVFDTLARHYELQPDAEITLEANPDDLTPAYIHMLRRLPFNRISIGIQTFDDETLRLLHRRHTAAQAIDAVRRCQDTGFENISIDLMYGLPKESLQSWEHDLCQAISLHVQHLSAYHLIYEEGTELWRLRRQHRVEEVDEDSSLAFFNLLMDKMKQAGFEHYEISNFALPGRYSRHNSSYWDGTKYMGCGAAAHSFNGVSRQWNIASLELYIKGIREGTIPAEIEQLDVHTRYNDRIITAIRTSKGLLLPALEKEFGKELHDFCLRNARPYLIQGKLTIENDWLRLTRAGIFISDGIMSDLLWVDEDACQDE